MHALILQRIMKKQLQPADIQRAAKVLRNGGIAVFPTESSYGLGGQFNDHKVVQRILQVKGRKDEKFTLIASSQEQVQQFFELSPLAQQLAQQYWPGPLSLVVNDQFSVRVPKLSHIQQLAELVGAPIIATSANKSGNTAAFTLEEAKRELGEDNVDVWLDGGELPKQEPSTIVDARTTPYTIIRQGALKVQSNE